MKYSRRDEDLIILNSFPCLTEKQRELVTEDGVVDFVKNSASLIKSVGSGVYNKVKACFSDVDYRAKTLENLEKKGVVCLTKFSQGYPERLKNTPEPPAILYCKGNLKLLETRCVGVVGSRRTPPNMLNECQKVAAELSKKFTVVTGLADGADSAAIAGALPSGKVISVIAYGFDFCYPAINQTLMEKTVEKGLVLSEYPPETQPRKFYFPQRNRIIAALSDGVLVVSAGKKSGALITSDYAFAYQREVFAFPYGLGAAAGEGCNAIIKIGAKLVENAADIYEALGEEYVAEERKISLSDDERIALEIIRSSGEAFAPEIASKMGKLPFQIIATLSSLEIKGLAVRLGGNRYAAT